MGLELGIVPARDGPSPALRCQPAASRVGSAGGASGERAKGPPPWFGDGPSWVACMKVPSGSARPVAGSVCCRGVVGGCYSRASKWLQKSGLGRDVVRQAVEGGREVPPVAEGVEDVTPEAREV